MYQYQLTLRYVVNIDTKWLMCASAMTKMHTGQSLDLLMLAQIYEKQNSLWCIGKQKE